MRGRGRVYYSMSTRNRRGVRCLFIRFIVCNLEASVMVVTFSVLLLRLILVINVLIKECGKVERGAFLGPPHGIFDFLGMRLATILPLASWPSIVVSQLALSCMCHKGRRICGGKRFGWEVERTRGLDGVALSRVQVLIHGRLKGSA